MSIWSFDEIPVLTLKHQFIMYIDQSETLVTLKEATKLWVDTPDLIFLLDYRLAGFIDQLREFLLVHNINENDIQNAFYRMITLENYRTTMEKEYQDELEALNLWMRSALYANMTSPGNKLFDIMKALNPEINEIIPQTSKERYQTIVKSLRKPARSPKLDLSGKLSKLAEGMVLDVSGLKPDGTGVKTIKMPSRPGKYGTASLAIVSSDFDHYLLAIQMLPDGERIYSDDLVYMANLFGVPYTPFGREAQVEQAPKVIEPFRPLLASLARSPKVDLEDKIFKLAPGKVLDVSGLKENGSGIRITDPPVRGKKTGTTTLPIVSGDFDHYLLAITMIPNGEQKYVAELIAIANHFGVPYIPKGEVEYDQTGEQIEYVQQVDDPSYDQEEEAFQEQAVNAEEIAHMSNLNYE